MATAAGTFIPSGKSAELAERRFFFIMALVMATVVVAGFSLNLAMGRATFAVPYYYHMHAVAFMSWLAFYVAQNGLIASGNVALHRRLGLLSLVLVPVMVVLGFVIMVGSMRRTGGPFFFDQNEFLISNSLMLVLFAGLVGAALTRRRYTGWHRRLMFCAMAILTGPGLGRLLPMPLLIPHAWRIIVLLTLIFPLIGMIADLRRHGRVHPAWLWGAGAILAAQAIGDLVAYSSVGVAITDAVLAGSPGAERPMTAYLP